MTPELLTPAELNHLLKIDFHKIFPVKKSAGRPADKKKSSWMPYSSPKKKIHS